MITDSGTAFHESLMKITGSSVTRILRRINKREVIDLRWRNEKTKEEWEFSYPLTVDEARALNSLSEIFEMEKLRTYFKILRSLKVWLRFKNYSKQETTMKNGPELTEEDQIEIGQNDGTGYPPPPEPASDDNTDEIDRNSGW